MAGLTELSLETHSPHELLIVLLPKGMPVLVPPDNHAFHVVRKDILRDAHVPEPVEHTNEQIFLLGVGEELHIPLTAVVADHSKAGNRVFFSGERLDLGKAPVHLERVSGAGGVPPPTVSLRSNRIASRRNEMLVRQDVVFNRGLAASISVCTEPAEAHSGVCHAVLQQTIQDTCIAAQERGARFPALCGVLSVLKAVLLHPAQSGAGNPGTALQLCKIDLLQRELVSLLGHHLLNGLCHNRGHGCEIGLFHLISFHRGLATPPV